METAVAWQRRAIAVATAVAALASVALFIGLTTSPSSDGARNPAEVPRAHALRHRRLDDSPPNSSAVLPVAPRAAAPAGADYSSHVVLRITPARDDHLALLSDEALFGAGLAADVWSESRGVGDPVDLMLHATQLEDASRYLRSHGVVFETAIADVQAAIEASHPYWQASAQALSAPEAGADFDLSQYHEFDEIMAWLDRTADTHPELASVVVLGDSYENRTVKGIKVGAGAEPKPVIFIQCGIHAREWVSPASCLYVIDALLSNSTATTNLITAFEWHIVPVTNADGYVYTWSGDRLWRKTRRPSQLQPGCIGADPNRNFDDHRCLSWMSTMCSTEVYCGDAPLSEPTSRNIARYLEGLKNESVDIKGFVDVHAYSQYWMWPWGWTEQLDPDSEAQGQCGHAAVKAVRREHHTSWKAGAIMRTIYQVGGSAVDWAYDKMGVKYSYAIELRDRGHFGFLLPADQIIPSGEELFAGLAAMATCMSSLEGR